MKRRHGRDSLVIALCNYLGRQNFAARVLDLVARLIPSPPLRPAYVGMGGSFLARRLSGLHRKIDWALDARPMLMARPTQPFAEYGLAPSTPHEPHRSTTEDPWWSFLWFYDHSAQKRADLGHAKAICSDLKYRGMHGRPCKHAGGTDTKCPAGSVSGWFWSYETPAGRIYYVDCCGGTPSSNKVWCNWTSEPNWCLGYGRAHNAGGISDYNCTLAILEADMDVRTISPGQYEVVGVDP
jgi:hypothetical protein